MYKKVLLTTFILLLGTKVISSSAQTISSSIDDTAATGTTETETSEATGTRTSRLGGYTEVTQAGRVPDHLYDIILGRPTDNSMLASVLAYKDMDAYLEYGLSSDDYQATGIVSISGGQPIEFLMDGLQKNTPYHYRLRYKLTDKETFESSEDYTFHTPREFGDSFVFTVQADSHLDENTSAEIYTNTLTNALDASPDFHLALGDTFMVDKYIDYPVSFPQYLAQRYYFGSFLNHSAPLFFALGNHDAESGGNQEITDWSTTTRNKLFPNPSPNEFYTGNEELDSVGKPIRNYYAFEWGNSLFVALDPFRYSPRRDKSVSNNWYMTLGKTQYDWLVKTLEESEATFKFVYLHNLVGGIGSNRGGAEASEYYEWGGHEADGSYTFDEMRPGWGKPIHDVLVENNVSIVFHGHDHMHITQERDGIIYQLLSQPGHRSGNANNAERYGYLSGDVVQGSGHLRVTVAEDQVNVDFIDSRLKGNGDILHSYVVKPKQ